MSLLVRPAPACFSEFLTRPNTYLLKLSTGSTFYFSVPFNMDWLRQLRPIELATLREYLSEIFDDVANRMGHVGMCSITDVRKEISARLSSADLLTEVENGAWTAGHGFPVFDIFHGLTTFFWDWNAIHFECGPSVVAWYARRLYDFQHKPSFERYAVRGSMCFEENKIGYRWWFEDRQLIIQWYCNSETVCLKTYGAAFRDLDEWKALKTQLESYELDMLKKGTARLRNAQNGGWELVVYSNEGPRGTSSDTSGLQYAYEPYSSAAVTYIQENRLVEETTPSYSNLCERCRYYPAPIPSSSGHLTEHIQTLDTCMSQTSSPSHPAPPQPSKLLQQANDLAKTVRDLESRLFHADQTVLSPQISPKSLPYPKPYLNGTVLPGPQLAAQTAIFPVTTIREDSIPPPQLYQSYAEDDHDDDGTEQSIRAVPNSWRDV